MRVRRPSGRISNARLTVVWLPASASSRSTASWMSSRSSKPRSSRSATPPSTRRKTGSQPRSIGVSSAIRSGRICDLLARDDSVPDNSVARHEAGHLSGCGGHEWLVQHDLDSGVSASGKLCGGLAGNRLRAVAELDSVYLGGPAVQLNCFDNEVTDGQRFAWADGDLTRRCVLVQDVQRRPLCDAYAAALPDREAIETFVLAEDAAVHRHDASTPRRPRSHPRQQIVLADTGEEAEVLALRLLRHR